MVGTQTDRIIAEHTARLSNWTQGDYENHIMGTAGYTQELYPCKALFSPVECNSLTIKNRIIAAPPGSLQTADAVSQLSFIRAVAAGGAGLVCTGYFSLSGSADAQSSLRETIESVHAVSSRIFLQLYPGNKRAKLPYISRRAISAPEFQLMILQTCRAAAGAKQYGFDGICLNLSEGYISDSAAVELVRQLRHFVGQDYPIMCRISISSCVNESLAYISDLVRSGADMFSVAIASSDKEWISQPPYMMPAGCHLDIIKLVRDYFIKAGIKSHRGIDVPVAATGKLGYPDIAEKALRDGMCDMVLLDRAVLADPDWCKKVYSGKGRDIRPCIGCQRGCTDRLHPRCAVNVSNRPLGKADKPKKIAVVGGGVAGMSFAIYAAMRGHEVEIYEKAGRLGGRLIADAIPLIRYDSLSYRRWLIVQLSKLDNIHIYLNTCADSRQLAAKRFDAIVYANGGADRAIPDIDGWGSIPYILSSELMTDSESSPSVTGKKVVVLGSGLEAYECAWWLKAEMGAGKVTVADERSLTAHAASPAVRSWFAHHFEKLNIELMSMTKPVKIFENRLFVRQNCSAATRSKPSDETFIRNIDCDLIVLAYRPQEDISHFIAGQSEFPAPEVYCIGSAFDAGDIRKNNLSAYRLAQML